jgi:hypothetical protein
MLCCNAQVTYTWESLDGWSGIPAGGYTLKNLVLPPPVPAEAGQTYKLRLTARFTGSTAAATADVALTAVGSQLSASLLGPSGDVMGDREIVLDASKSVDPDDPKVWVARVFRQTTAATFRSLPQVLKLCQICVTVHSVLLVAKICSTSIYRRTAWHAPKPCWGRFSALLSCAYIQTQHKLTSCSLYVQGASPLSFSWDCVREDFPKPCFAGTAMGDIKGSRWGAVLTA